MKTLLLIAFWLFAVGGYGALYMQDYEPDFKAPLYFFIGTAIFITLLVIAIGWYIKTLMK